MIITHKLQPMDLTHKQNTSRVDIVQDDKYSRDIEFTLTSNGVAWQIPDGTTAIVRYKKPDGTGGNYDTLPDGSTAYQINGNVLTVALAPQVCTVQGPVQLSVGIIHGSAEINTFTVNIAVHPNPGAEYQSEDYIRLSGAVPNSGWTPNMYIGTDASGNVVAKEGTSGGGGTVSVDSTLTQSGQAADAAVVGNRISALSEEIANVNSTDKPYNMQNIGVLYENPEGYGYVAWCPGNLKYDSRLDKYVSLIYASTQHNNGGTALFVSYIDPQTYEASKPVQCFTDDGATALTGSTAFWIDDDGTYKMMYKYTDNNTYLFTSVDGGINWTKGDAVSGFSGSPWGITRLSNGRLIFGDDATKAGIYYSDNDGINWTQVIPGTAGGDYEAEACILEIKPGKLIAIARYSMSGIGYNASGDSESAIVSFSEDYGASWTAWKKSKTITNMNASTCTGRVHNGLVDVFAASRWYWHGSYSNTDYNNTGKTGAITHYTATIENALADNFTNNGILVYANAVGDGSSQDFHSPALAAKGDEILLMWFDRIPPYTEEKTSHYFARGAVGTMNYAPNDDLVSVVFPYSSAMVEKLLKKQYTELMAKINEIVIGGGGTPDIGNDPENPTSYIVDGIVLNLKFTDSNTHNTENMTVTDTVNSFVGSLTTKQFGTTLVDTFPVVRNNSIAPSYVTFQADTLSQVMEAPYELSIEVAMYKYTDDTVGNMTSVEYLPFRSNGKGGVSLGIRSNGVAPFYLNTSGSAVNTNEMSNKFPTVLEVTDGVLAHAIVTFANDGTVSVYKNGELVISEVISSTFAQWAPVTLTRGFAFYGPLKSARIYNRVLTAEEVLNNYNYELKSIV